MSAKRTWPWRRGRPDGPPTLLVDHWYSHAVGHVIEALRRCQGYHVQDPELRIALVLNRASPTELATCAPFVSEIFGVPYTSFGAPVGSPRRALRRVPRDWDHVVHHPAATDPAEQRFEGLQRYYEASRRHFRGRLSVGVAGEPPPAYAPHQQLRLVLPERERAAARQEFAARRSIAVMPAGSGARYLYPSTASWLVILAELERRFPDAVFTFVGRLGAAGGRTTSGISRGEVDLLVGSRRRSIDSFDRPILEQLALVEGSSVFVSPHTGFGFAAVAVGTPLAHSFGRRLARVLLQRSSVLLGASQERRASCVRAQSEPADDRRRLRRRRAPNDDDERPPSARGPRRARRRRGTARSTGGSRTKQPSSTTFPRLLEAYAGDRSQLFSFEDVHLPYV